MKIKLNKPFAANSAVDEFDVKQVKKALNRLGYYQPYEKTGITGIPDADVFFALKSFQKDQGLQPRLTDLLINDTITKDVYDRKFAQIQARRKEITILQAEHQDGNEEFKIALTTLVSLASKATEILKSSKTPVKRSLISLVFSNLQLSAGTLQYSLREPFKTLQNLGAVRDTQ